MSSMRNAVQRRNHKERSQPAERQKWGLLEKRKDYQLRAKDYNKKKAALSTLTRLAQDRNPDEFHFKMVNSRTKGGVKVSERPDTAKDLDHDALKLLKTQDAGYLRVQSAIERSKIQQLEQDLAFIDGEAVKTSGGKHTVFVDDEESARSFEPAEFFGTHPDLVNQRYNRPRMEQLEGQTFGGRRASTGNMQDESAREEQKDRRKLQKQRESKYKELDARMKREEELRKVERELELQRARMRNGNVVKNKWTKIRRR